MDIIVRDVHCPICGAPEVDPENPGKLLVRGFKVQMKQDGPWWSQCISGRDHGTFTVVHVDDNNREEEIAFPAEPWFALQDDGSFDIEVNRHHYHFEAR